MPYIVEVHRDPAGSAPDRYEVRDGRADVEQAFADQVGEIRYRGARQITVRWEDS